MSIIDAETNTDDLSAALTRLVRSVDGVSAVYSSKPVVETAVATVVETIKHASVGLHLVVITRNEHGIEVNATIGVADDEPARDVCRRVYDALASYLDETTAITPSLIRVKVGRVG